MAVLFDASTVSRVVDVMTTVDDDNEAGLRVLLSVCVSARFVCSSLSFAFVVGLTDGAGVTGGVENEKSTGEQLESTPKFLKQSLWFEKNK